MRRALLGILLLLVGCASVFSSSTVSSSTVSSSTVSSSTVSSSTVSSSTVSSSTVSSSTFLARTVLASTVSASAVSTEPLVRVGLEQLASGDFEDVELDGKRLGLIVHAASITYDGQHAIDVLSQKGLNVVRLFTPEHGLRSRAAAGEKVAGGVDEESGLPIVSLYGKRRKPQTEDLTGLDVLIFDLQGAGVRFYTYVSTLILCLEAAAENDLDFVVLDRPNPLGGVRVEGPLAAPRSLVPKSFVNLAPGPLVHGLTLGEMARLVNAGRLHRARLTIVPMGGWQRSMTWRDTGRPWPLPSPNLRSPESALAYPGLALLEATNVSEGRGTSAPFLRFGAPWLKCLAPSSEAPSEKCLAPTEIAGFQLVPTRFTPKASQAAPQPKYLDQECLGYQIRIGDPAKIEPYRLGLELLRQLSQSPEFEWRRDGEALTWLLGTPKVFRDLRSGKSIDAILAADKVDHMAWQQARRSALLYRDSDQVSNQF